MTKIAPSILTADFSRLGEQIREAETAGADYLHLDVMDGHFVPNISFGPAVVRACREITDLPLDVHLMIEKPERYIAAFAEAGADIITVHLETCPHLHRTLALIHEHGVQAGLAVNPLTPVEVYLQALPLIELALVMSVNPGFGGQEFIDFTTTRLELLRAWRNELNRDCIIEVDGGINPHTAPVAVGAGADLLVVGSSVFNSHASVAENMRVLRDSIRPTN